MKGKGFREEIKAGMIVALFVIILSAFIILIGGTSLFEKTDHYTVKVMNAAGLEVGSQVRLGGVRAGRVTDIRAPAAPAEPVTITVGIKQGTRLYEGTRALITQLGFVGDIYLLLTVGGTNEAVIKPGETIPSVEPVDFGVILTRVETLSVSVNTLVQDINKIFSQRNIEGIEKLVSTTNTAIEASSASINRVADSLTKTTARVDSVLAEVEALVKDNRGEISRLITKAREDLEKAGSMIASFEKTARTVDRTVELQSANLDTLLATMTRTAEELEAVIQELKAKPWSVIYKESGGR